MVDLYQLRAFPCLGIRAGRARGGRGGLWAAQHSPERHREEGEQDQGGSSTGNHHSNPTRTSEHQQCPGATRGQGGNCLALL